MDSGGKAEKAWCFSNPCLSDWIFNDKYTQLTNKTQQECFFQARLKTGKREQALEDSCELEWKFKHHAMFSAK